MYQMDISATQLSSITDKVIPALNEWRTRPLQSVYAFVYLDCMHYKVRENGRVVTRAIYNILGVDLEGKKDLIGMYVSESEGAKFWLSVITDLKNRGVEDILIACIDGLKGFPEAIGAVFPLTQIQTCVVHQIRNSLRYIAEKDKKAFMVDLKTVYQAVNKEEGFEKLAKLDEVWGDRRSAKNIQFRFNHGIIIGKLYLLFLSMMNRFVGLFIRPIPSKDSTDRSEKLLKQKGHLLRIWL